MKYLRILIIGILAISYTSCKESFLTKDSETFLTKSTFYKTAADFQSAINGAYAPLRIINNASLGNGKEWLMAEMHSDNSRYIYNTATRGEVPSEHIADFVPDANVSSVQVIYTQYYLIISRANQILSLIDGAEIDAAVKSNVKGQALFLRAFSYFHLVQYFGELPLHLVPVTTKEEAALPLSSVSSIYDQMVLDLTAAVDLLPLKSKQTDLGRVTKGTANTLLGNVYMILKNYSKAEAQFVAVISSGEYHLLGDYSSVFDPSKKNHAESIFEVQYLESSDGYSSDFIFNFLPNPVDAAEVLRITGVSNPSAIAGGGWNIPSPELIDAYESGDLRKAASIGTCTLAYGVSAPYIKKYAHKYALQGICGDNWPVYRYSEVLLFMAEALNEQGKPTDAKPYINQVRTRAGLGALTVTSQADVRTAIANERRVELAFENKRWFDLLRTGKALEVMTAYGQRVRANQTKYYFPAEYDMANSAVYKQIDLLFPKPAAETLVSPYF